MCTIKSIEMAPEPKLPVINIMLFFCGMLHSVAIIYFMSKVFVAIAYHMSSIYMYQFFLECKISVKISVSISMVLIYHFSWHAMYKL